MLTNINAAGNLQSDGESDGEFFPELVCGAYVAEHFLESCVRVGALMNSGTVPRPSTSLSISGAECGSGGSLAAMQWTPPCR